MDTSRIASLAEKTLSEEAILEGIIFDVVRRHVELPNGREAPRDIVRRFSEGVAVVAVDDIGRVCLVQQYRNPLQSFTLELPAGLLNRGESPDDGARRELAEETGASAGHLMPLATIVSSPGFTDETVNIYLATELTFGRAHPDEGEFINASFFEFGETISSIIAGEIVDAKTVVGILRAALYLGIVNTSLVA